MPCTICHQPVVLVPSAAERARKYQDHPASYYTQLFTEHAECTLRKRAQDTRALMQRIREDQTILQMAEGVLR